MKNTVLTTFIFVIIRYIKKDDIDHIERFESSQDFYEWLYLNHDETIFSLSSSLTVADLIRKMSGYKCVCRDWCACSLQIYPLFLKNTFAKEPKEKSKSVIPKSVFYMIHPDERNHMERFLTGTDDELVKEEFKKRKINND